MSIENPNFLKQKYNLHNAPEVKKSAERAETKTGKKILQNPDAQIQNYLDRLEKLILDPDKTQKRKILNGEQRPRALLMLREMVMNKYVRQNKEKMAEGAARVEERAAREMGMEIEYNNEALEQRGDIAVTDLEKSLDQWISYLSDMNEPYPTWFRYYVFRNILDLGDYDKDKGEFTKRSQGSTRLFPDIDRGALAYVEQMVEASKNPKILEQIQKAQQAAANNNIPADQLITKEKANNFAKLSFAKQYAEAIKQAGEITPEMKKETRGKWIKYQQGTDPTALWASLQNKGTAWCTKGFATADTQLKGGDFFVYYTLDSQGKPTIPRIAIRMDGRNNQQSIGEIRGVADNDQNLEGNMAEIAEEKAKKLNGYESYQKKYADMKLLTKIDKKIKKQESLTKDELVFLYEIDNQIDSFGYQRDLRIAEIRKARNVKEDAQIVLECTPEEIAQSVNEIDENTKAYIGELDSNIFQLIQKYNIEHIYTKFPEGKIQTWEMELGGRTKEEILKELEKREKAQGDEKIYIYNYAKDMLKRPEFFASEKNEQGKFIKVKVGDLGFSSGATTQEIYNKAEELGLELCPPETGPTIRLDYEKIFGKEQPKGEYLRIAMKQIRVSDGDPRVFYVLRYDDDESWLDSTWAEPDYEWNADDDFVFRFRKFEI